MSRGVSSLAGTPPPQKRLLAHIPAQNHFRRMLMHTSVPRRLHPPTLRTLFHPPVPPIASQSFTRDVLLANLTRPPIAAPRRRVLPGLTRPPIAAPRHRAQPGLTR